MCEETLAMSNGSTSSSGSSNSSGESSSSSSENSTSITTSNGISSSCNSARANGVGGNSSYFAGMTFANIFELFLLLRKTKE